MVNKTVLVVGERTAGRIEDEKVSFGVNDSVFVKNVDPESGDALRGYNADLIVLTTEVSQEVMNTVLRPMTCMGGEIIHLE